MHTLIHLSVPRDQNRKAWKVEKAMSRNALSWYREKYKQVKLISTCQRDAWKVDHWLQDKVEAQSKYKDMEKSPQVN